MFVCTLARTYSALDDRAADMGNEEHRVFNRFRIVYIARPSRHVVARRDHVLAEANFARQHNDLFSTFMVVKRKTGTGLECDEVRAIAVSPQIVE